MVQKRLYARILELVKPYWGVLAIAMVSMVAVAGLSAVQAYMVKPLLDEIFFRKDRTMLNVLPFALLGLFFVKGIFYYTYSYLMDFASQSIIRGLRVAIYRHVQSLSLSFFQRMTTGELISRIMNDVNLLQGSVTTALVGLMKDMCQVVGLLVVIFYQDWKLALMSLVFIPMAVIPIANFAKRYRRLSTNAQQTNADASSILHETISGNRIVKAFCMEEYEIERFGRIMDDLFRIILTDARLKAIAHPIMEMLGGVGIALIMWYGGHQVLSGHSSPGTFFSFLTALIMIYEPIKGVSKVNNTVQQGIAASSRIFDLLDIAPEIQDRPGAITAPPIRSGIAFEGVSFSYDGTEAVLTDIHLKVKADEVIALVGPSGGGKTTLANLVPRFYDVTAGRITIDGVDLRDMTMQSLRAQIGIVTQQTILFNDTVRNNIAYGDPAMPEEKIIEAARSAHALEFILPLPQGFDTVIGESGSRLSGGQRQRISIARALLKNAPILILDEATAALDAESEREVQKALENLMKNRTTFVIAHRLSTIRNADRIIVIQDGRIVEEGSHERLIERKGLYERLHAMQHVA